MNEIDYSKWYGKILCPFCEKNPSSNDINIEEIKVRVRTTYSSFEKKVKDKRCATCGVSVVTFVHPMRIVLGNLFFFFIFGCVFIYVPRQPSVEGSLLFEIIFAIFLLIVSCLLLFASFRNRSKCMVIIKKIESKKPT
tara:strand:+ start:50 stop:463 length:414 start_codon:yes stop_codon:yes gene_type:complete